MALNILGSYDSFAELLENHPIGNIGDAYFVNDDAYVWPESIKEWTNVGKRWEVE
jgi:hypothetical protein